MMDEQDPEGYGNYLYREFDEVPAGRPDCRSCGDPVKVVYYSGRPRYAQHCRECYAELKHGKIPRAPQRRKSL